MESYMIVVLWAAIAAVCYGFIVPALVSMSDTVAVILGFAVAVVIAPTALWLIGKYLYNKHFKKEETK